MARLSHLRFLITAGPTREYIDPVRYISNDSSGKMGFALAGAAAARGHRVTLIHGPVGLKAAQGVRTIPVTSAADMLTACLERWPRQDVLIMAAAVADYAPVRLAKGKLKKAASGRVLRLKPTVDVLAALASRRNPEQLVIGFALEDRNARRNAQAKLQRKRLDAIVLNRPETIGADRATVELLVAGRPWETVPAGVKARLAPRLIRVAEKLHRSRAT
jgi:phosphopantothenoylcysteine decarboxylase/phosphopantothenate--cysteine ligase